jgi:hypothetical protein
MRQRWRPRTTEEEKIGMAERVRDHLGRFGVWRSGGMVTPELAAGLERLGFGTLWLGGSPPGNLAQAEQLLDAATGLG